MKLLFSLSLAAILGLATPALADLQCHCDHVPIKPKECVDHCFSVLLSNLSQVEIEDALGLDAQLGSDIVAISTAGPIESISDLRDRLPERDFEQLRSTIEAAASGRSQSIALREQLAAIGTVTYDTELTDVQIAALDDEEGREVAPDYNGDTTGAYAEDTDSLPATASGMPLLVLFGGTSLAAGLALFAGFRFRTKGRAEHS